MKRNSPTERAAKKALPRRVMAVKPPIVQRISLAARVGSDFLRLWKVSNSKLARTGALASSRAALRNLPISQGKPADTTAEAPVSTVSSVFRSEIFSRRT